MNSAGRLQIAQRPHEAIQVVLVCNYGICERNNHRGPVKARLVNRASRARRHGEIALAAYLGNLTLGLIVVEERYL